MRADHRQHRSRPNRISRTLESALRRHAPASTLRTRGVPSVNVYAEGATGDATPIQDISGSNTGLNSPSDVAVDASGNIYVANWGNNSVTVYAAGATGNVAPIQDISGSMTGLVRPDGLALNPLNGDIYVASSPGPNGGKITIYPSGSTGNIAPTGKIEGMRTGIYYPVELALGATGKIYVPNRPQQLRDGLPGGCDPRRSTNKDHQRL